MEFAPTIRFALFLREFFALTMPRHGDFIPSEGNIYRMSERSLFPNKQA